MQTLPRTLYRLELGFPPGGPSDLGWLPLAVASTWRDSAALISATAVEGARAAVAVIEWLGAPGVVNVSDKLSATLPGMPLGASGPSATVLRVDEAGPAETASVVRPSTGQTYVAAAALLAFVSFFVHRARRGAARS